MAKKNDFVKIENVELRPQVIGTAYRKKSNLGRVIFLFVALLLVVYYINDISVFINKLLGRESAQVIREIVEEEDKTRNEEKEAKEEIVYSTISNDLSISFDNLIANNFTYANKVISFDIVNNSSNSVNVSNNKYYLETYNVAKTLLERKKIDLSVINGSSKVNKSFTLNNDFEYIVISKKNESDYPSVTLNNIDGRELLSCTKDNEKIDYYFVDKELQSIKHTITNSNIYDSSYQVDLVNYQNIVNNYSNITGVSASMNSTAYGFTATIEIDLANTDMSKLNNSYYYGYKEEAKVVSFEMSTNDFVCK